MSLLKQNICFEASTISSFIQTQKMEKYMSNFEYINTFIMTYGIILLIINIK